MPVEGPAPEILDREMMTRCIALAVRSGREGEYPYGVVICRAGAPELKPVRKLAHRAMAFLRRTVFDRLGEADFA